jgi:hypothetical protein
LINLQRNTDAVVLKPRQMFQRLRDRRADLDIVLGFDRDPVLVLANELDEKPSMVSLVLKSLKLPKAVASKANGPPLSLETVDAGVNKRAWSRGAERQRIPRAGE